MQAPEGPSLRDAALTGLVVAALAWPAWAAAQAATAAPPAPRTPGSGFVDPQGLPPRLALPDVEPVYRAAAIDTLATIRKRGTGVLLVRGADGS